MQLDHPSDDFSQYEGATPEEVLKEYNEHRFSWNLNLFSYKQKQIKLDPFNKSCIGIETKRNYVVSLNVIRKSCSFCFFLKHYFSGVDYWKVVLLVFGIFLFISADKLSQNTMFYYICGVTLGICTSFLILIYFLSKLFPKVNYFETVKYVKKNYFRNP